MLRRLFKQNTKEKGRRPDSPATLIVGLGNPGAKYAQTRHNLGFMVVDQMGSEIDGRSRERFQGQLLETNRDGRTVVLLKPLTYMNNSGESVAQVARWYRIPPEQILVIYDELDLPFGTLRLRPKGSAGGHNGLGSVLQHLKSDDVPRLRIGIGRPARGSTVSYVLSRFFEDERPVVPEIIDTAARAAWMWLDEGIEPAMNEFNGVRIERSEARAPSS